MSIIDIGGLIEDVGVAFGVPILFLILAFANIRLSANSRYSGLKMRLSLTFAIALFLCSMSAVVIQDRATLMNLWLKDPILGSFAYFAGGVLVIAGIGTLINRKLRPTLWQNHPE